MCGTVLSEIDSLENLVESSKLLNKAKQVTPESTETTTNLY